LARTGLQSVLTLNRLATNNKVTQTEIKCDKIKVIEEESILDKKGFP
jgi:ribosomal protein L20A (L18A)